MASEEHTDLRQVLAALSRIEGRLDAADEWRQQQNGRFKRIEHTVFGDEERDKIGLVEKVRRFDGVTEAVLGDEEKGILPMPERLRNLESGWAKLTTVAVLACSVGIEGVRWGWNFVASALSSGAKTH